MHLLVDERPFAGYHDALKRLRNSSDGASPARMPSPPCPTGGLEERHCTVAGIEEEVENPGWWRLA
jgi:hypothetical protein